ncbi:MAG: LamG domain-containing protein [Catenulispora sp.]
MFRDRRQHPDQPVKLVWDPEEPDDGAAAKADHGPAAPRPWTRHRGRVLVAAAVIVPLAGGAVGLAAYGGRGATTAAAVTPRVPTSTANHLAGSSPSSSPSPSAVPSSSPVPSPSPDPSPSPTPDPNPGGNTNPAPGKSPASSSSAPPPRVVTVVTTAPPATTHPAAAPPAPSTPRPVGFWSLSHSVLDSAGSHNGTAVATDWNGGAAVFAGASPSAITTSGPVLATGPGKSFTVSASVFLTSLPAVAATAVSQDAGTASSFFLQYLRQCTCWAFARVAGDTADPSADRAQSGSPARANAWTHLVGVYDAANGALSLYVNGKLAGAAVDQTPFASNGPLAIGRAYYNGKPTDWFHGLITTVQVFDKALSPAEVAALQ